MKSISALLILSDLELVFPFLDLGLRCIFGFVASITSKTSLMSSVLLLGGMSPHKPYRSWEPPGDTFGARLWVYLCWLWVPDEGSESRPISLPTAPGEICLVLTSFENSS